jgi:hypothetical protein
MRLIHTCHCSENACESFSLTTDLSRRSNTVQIFRDLSTPLVLCKEHLNELLVRAAGLAHLGEDVLLFQGSFVILLTEFSEKFGRLCQRCRLDLTTAET